MRERLDRLQDALGISPSGQAIGAKLDNILIQLGSLTHIQNAIGAWDEEGGYAESSPNTILKYLEDIATPDLLYDLSIEFFADVIGRLMNWVFGQDHTDYGILAEIALMVIDFMLGKTLTIIGMVIDVIGMILQIYEMFAGVSNPSLDQLLAHLKPNAQNSPALSYPSLYDIIQGDGTPTNPGLSGLATEATLRQGLIREAGPFWGVLQPEESYLSLVHKQLEPDPFYDIATQFTANILTSLAEWLFGPAKNQDFLLEVALVVIEFIVGKTLTVVQIVLDLVKIVLDLYQIFFGQSITLAEILAHLKPNAQPGYAYPTVQDLLVSINQGSLDGATEATQSAILARLTLPGATADEQTLYERIVSIVDSLSSLSTMLGEDGAVQQSIADMVAALIALPADICACIPSGGGSGLGDGTTPLLPPGDEESEEETLSADEKCEIAHAAIAILRQKADSLSEASGDGDGPNKATIQDLAELLNVSPPQLMLSPMQLLDVLTEVKGLASDVIYLGDLLPGDFDAYDQFICGIATADSPATARAGARAAIEFANYWVGGTMTPRPQQVRFVRIYMALLTPSLFSYLWQLPARGAFDEQGRPINTIGYPYNCDSCADDSDDPDDPPPPPEEPDQCDGADFGSTSDAKKYFSDKNKVRWYQKNVSVIDWDTYGYPGEGRRSESWGISHNAALPIAEDGQIGIRLVSGVSQVRAGVRDSLTGSRAPGGIRLEPGDSSCHTISVKAGDFFYVWNEENDQFTVEVALPEPPPPPSSSCESGTVYNSVLSTLWGYNAIGNSWSTSQRHAIHWDGGESRVADKWGVSPNGGLVINQHSVAYVQLLSDNGYDVQAHYGPLTTAAPPFTKLIKNDYTTCYTLELQEGDRFYIRAGGNTLPFSVRVNIQPFEN